MKQCNRLLLSLVIVLLLYGCTDEKIDTTWLRTKLQESIGCNAAFHKNFKGELDEATNSFKDRGMIDDALTNLNIWKDDALAQMTAILNIFSAGLTWVRDKKYALKVGDLDKF